MLQKKYLLGVGITAAKTDIILENVVNHIKSDKKKLFLVTPNPEIIVYAQKHLAFKDKINSADVALADGIGVLLASRLLSLGIPERTTGVDFIEKLCKVARRKPLSMGFLGGWHGVAQRTAECLQQKYPWIDVVFTGEEWLDKDAKTQKPIDILFVAYGFPKQEEWISDNLEKLPVKAAMGVGGAFDFISGNVPRAPKVMRSMGLEWLFRLIVQPSRFKRQLALPQFIFLVLRERLAK